MEEKSKNLDSAVKAQAPKTKEKEKKTPRFKPILTAEKLLKWKQSFFMRVISAVLAVLLAVVCFNYAHDYVLDDIGNGAYKYDESSYDFIKESIKNYLGEDGPDIAFLQDNIPYWTSSYANGETTLVCTMKDGFFVAEVTAYITKDFQLITEKPEDKDHDGFIRNFDSLDEYQDFFWKSIKKSTLILGAEFFAVTLAVLVLIDLVSTWALQKMIANKAKKASTQTTESRQEQIETSAEAVKA